MKTKYLYLIICVEGTVIPYYHLGLFIFNNGLNVEHFFDQMLGTDIAAFFSWDVIISTLGLTAFVMHQGRKKGIKNLWVFIVFNLTVGVSLALQAFLYALEVKKENTPQ